MGSKLFSFCKKKFLHLHIGKKQETIWLNWEIPLKSPNKNEMLKNLGLGKEGTKIKAWSGYLKHTFLLGLILS